MSYKAQFLVDDEGVYLPDMAAGMPALDICFDGVRIWSVAKDEIDQDGFALWPAPLKAYLTGKTTVSLHESATGESLAQTPARFGSAEERIRVIDGAGNPLAINKWGKLAKTLERAVGDIQQVIIEKTQELIAWLKAYGLEPFIVGGTLLGAVRESRLLPHDDDADLAYLSAHTNPADVALENLRLARALSAAGYHVVRHSAAHLQLHFSAAASTYYIDIFSAYFDSLGYINQPFHVRGKMLHEQMLPFREVEISGEKFPAPAVAEKFLTINYDENWAVPNPAFKLETPEATTRRFNNYFGGYEFGKEFWEEFYEDPDAKQLLTWCQSAETVLEYKELLQSPTLLEIGSGNGKLAKELRASANKRVIAADFIKSQETERIAGVENSFLNLNRYDCLLVPKFLGITSAFDIVANHVLEQISSQARQNALRLIRLALKSGGLALATFNTALTDSYSPNLPTTWHLEPAQLFNEAAQLGLEVRVVTVRAEAPARPALAIFEKVSSKTRRRK